MQLSRRDALNIFALTTAGTVARPVRGIFAQNNASHDPILRDPLRPSYHLLPARGWINDPCAPVYWHGEYHMFHQYNPNAAVWGDMHWAHAVSSDMIHWKRLPVALAPTPGGPDAQGCFTGSSILHNRHPAIIYTGVEAVPLEDATLSDGNNNFRETQLLATASDNTLGTWIKHPQAVIPSPPPGMKITGFRDPTPFRVGDIQYLLVGSGEPRKGGMVLLYQATSDDLTQWKYLHPLAQGKWSGTPGTNPVDTGEMWECPDFFPLGTGGKHVLIYSTQGRTLWHCGTLDKKTMLFQTERSGELDYGKGSYYAPKTQLDSKGNRILWGWIRETRPEAEYSRAGWAGMISLPRILTLNGNDLMMEPAPQIESLRNSANPNPSKLPDTRQEFRCVIQSANAGEPLPYRITDPIGVLVEVRSTKNQSPRTLLVDDAVLELPEPLPAQAGLHLFFDNSVIEIFVDSRFCITRRFYARTPDKPIVTLTFPGQPRVARAQSFSLKSIWLI